MSKWEDNHWQVGNAIPHSIDPTISQIMQENHELREVMKAQRRMIDLQRQDIANLEAQVKGLTRRFERHEHYAQTRLGTIVTKRIEQD